MTEAEPQTTFVVTDIEADGPTPLHSSMLSFASVAISATGERFGEFEAVLKPRQDRKADETTMAWWQTQPEAWEAATANAEAPEIVMPRYADWVESLPGFRVFAAAPMIFDGLWMDHYLDEFAGTRVLGGPFKTRQIFRGGGVCLYTMAGALRGAPYLNWGMQRVPAEWYGHIEHTHKAIDDARGFANVLVKLFSISSGLERIEATESMYR
ncbi:DNA polymerase III subunit epsilon [Paradevosia shaoguanensis]|uniref:DNA polymerase III subunit epsilon n=1 Tax=Paradevosia shaoguanensis TaxID=1335043 RepID=UPI003C7665D5